MIDTDRQKLLRSAAEVATEPEVAMRGVLVSLGGASVDSQLISPATSDGGRRRSRRQSQISPVNGDVTTTATMSSEFARVKSPLSPSARKLRRQSGSPLPKTVANFMKFYQNRP